MVVGHQNDGVWRAAPLEGTTAVVLADAFARSRCYDGGVMGIPMEGVISMGITVMSYIYSLWGVYL